jgi:hypothetical protein
MSHFAKLDQNNIVIFVTVGRQEDDGKEKELSERTGDTYKQTSYNTRNGIHYNAETNEPSLDQSKALRKNFAGVGYSYDKDRDAFIPPQPYPSWTLNEQTCNWDSPVPYPNDGSIYSWNEGTQVWDKVR